MAICSLQTTKVTEIIAIKDIFMMTAIWSDYGTFQNGKANK
jgi:hypothetical protein